MELGRTSFQLLNEVVRGAPAEMEPCGNGLRFGNAVAEAGEEILEWLIIS